MIPKALIPYFLGFITIGVLLGFLFIVKKEKRITLPKSWARLSWPELLNYFKEAIEILKNKRWLFYVPLIFVLTDRVIQFGFFLYNRVKLQDVRAFEDLAKGHRFAFTLSEAITTLIKAINSLDYGFTTVFGGGSILITVVLVFGYRFIFKQLKKRRIRQIKLFIRMLQYAFLALITLGLPLIPLAIFQPETALTASLGMTLLFVFQIIGLVSTSLIEAIFLLAMLQAINKEQFDSKRILNGAMQSLRTFIILNIILASFGFVNQIQAYIYTVYQFLPHQNTLMAFPPYFQVILKYSTILLSLATIPAPFLLVLTGQNLRTVLKQNFLLIWRNLPKYLIVIFAGIIIYLIPEILNLLIKNSTATLSYWRVFWFDMTSILRLLIGVIYTITLYLFVIKVWTGKEREDREFYQKTL